MLSKPLNIQRTVLVCTIPLLLATASLAQTTINVGPGQAYTTIQSGINAAVNGDTVLVAPGTYYEQLNFNGKGITLVSSGGAANTIIDGSGTGTVVFMSSTSTSELAILDGFTIQHGYPNGVGGGPSYNYGGAVDVDGNAIIRNNTIANNTSCGVDVLDSNVTVQNNHIFNNLGANTAGADCRVNAYGILVHNITTSGANINLLNNLIEENENGGISVYDLFGFVTINITKNIIRNNGLDLSLSGIGTGISFGDYAGYNIVGNLITGSGGPGIYEFLGQVVNFVNNTVYFNSLMYTPQYTFQGTEVQMQNVAGVLSNNIIVGNRTPYPVISCVAGTSGTSVTWDNNIVYNTVTGTASIPCFPDPTGINLYVNPKLNNPAGGDYHLAPGSPAIDAGNDSAPLITTTDLDGNFRVQNATGKGCIIDIGVYEYPGTVSGCTTTETLTSSKNPSNYTDTVTFTTTLTSSNGVPTGEVQFSDGSTVLGTQGISGSGVSTYSTSALAIGSHPITATYQPTGVFATASANLTQVVNGYVTTTNLVCTVNPIYLYGTTLLTATVSSVNGTPAGSIAFTDNGAALATQTLLNGTTSLTYTGQVIGTHTLTATYVPTGSFSASSASCSEVVNALPTTSVLTVSPTSTSYGSPVILTAVVSPMTPLGAGTPTGNVTFYNGATALNAPVNLAGGVASLTVSNLPGGTDNLTCTYNGSGIYATSQCKTVPVSISAAASTLTLTSSLNPAPALTAVTFAAHLTYNGPAALAGNTIVLSLNGQTISLTTDATGSATYSISTLTPGTYHVSATFAATTSLLASSASLTEVITAVPTATSLIVLPNPAYFSQLVTMTANVTASGGTVTSGTVTFFDGSTALASQPVTSGTATYTTTTLAVGTHPITATYNPTSPDYLASTSSVVNEVILASGFQIALSPTTMTLAPGATGTDAILLTSVGNFAGPLALTYGTLPIYATASINPMTVTLTADGTGSSTFTLKTLLKASNTIPTRPGTKELPVIFTAFLLLLAPVGFTRRRMFTRILGGFLLLMSLQAITGCTNAWYTAEVVAPGAYPLTITATDIHGITQSATLTVIVTP